jgi:hypothetical protein
VNTGAGADRVSAGPGDDRVMTGAGNDRVNPGSGRDRVSTGAGNDRVGLAGATSDHVDCGTGHDRTYLDRADRSRRAGASHRSPARTTPRTDGVVSAGSATGFRASSGLRASCGRPGLS